MAKTIVGTFESAAEAERVASALEDSGIERRHIQVIDSATASGREQQWRGEPESSGGFWSWLFGDVEDLRWRGPADAFPALAERLGSPRLLERCRKAAASVA